MSFVAKRVIASPKKFKFKRSNLKLWLMTLPFILLLVGLGTAAFLLSTNSDLRQQAAVLPYTVCRTPRSTQCSSDGSAVQTCIGYKLTSVTCKAGSKCEVYQNKPQCLPIANCTFWTNDNKVFECRGNTYYGCKNGKYQKMGGCNSGTTCVVTEVNQPFCSVSCGEHGAVGGCGPNGKLKLCHNTLYGGDENGWEYVNCGYNKTCKVQNGQPGCY